jgi:tRNA (uracil-5-)-methyltransferase
MEMKCKHFGECGSCTLYNLPYREQIEKKSGKFLNVVKKFGVNIDVDEVELFESPSKHYRARAEFRIWHKGGRCFYAMGNIKRDGVVLIDECPKVIETIFESMPKLLELINSENELKHKLFGLEFLSGLYGDILVVMLYHRKLCDSWRDVAKRAEESLTLSIVGRSRKQKVVLSKDYIEERFKIGKREYLYHYVDGNFTQPNPFVNLKMLLWVKELCRDIKWGDLLEIYCGAGNFTVAIAEEFNRVLATEINKNSINSAKLNMKLNCVENIHFVRLSSKEMTEALSGKREFNRLRGVDINSYNFSTVLVDPPRAGLDIDTIDLVSKIENIIYISCNVETLKRDLETLIKTHRVEKVALFDQFPYTNHIESGIFLRRRG